LSLSIVGRRRGETDNFADASARGGGALALRKYFLARAVHAPIWTIVALGLARFPLKRNRLSDKKSRLDQNLGANSDRKGLSTFAEFALSRPRTRKRDILFTRKCDWPAASTWMGRLRREELRSARRASRRPVHFF